ncbi:MAG: putative Ig domain-containing protein, partial [Defluviitaleaceae bacterium]|nr:putative Ig domain-containing protein [Defluviitaleaceae bacterium]
MKKQKKFFRCEGKKIFVTSRCFLRKFFEIGSAPRALRCVIIFIFLFSVRAHATNITIDNPYANVNWNTWHQFKTALHVHTDNSDGSNTPTEIADEHYRLGFHILAFTDHTYTSPAPNKIESPMDSTRVSRMYTGVASRTEGGGHGMIFVPFTNERSAIFEEISPAADSHHIGAYWSNVSNSRRPIPTLMNDLIAEGTGGLAILNHPGRNTLASRSRTTSLSTARAISNRSEIFLPYANLFRAHSNLIGMEIINQLDWESQADRVLWDNILANTMPHGKNVWGFSNDDSHRNRAVGYSYNLMLMPELSLAEFRTSMETGAFFAFSRIDRNLEIYATGLSSSSSASPSDSLATSLRALATPSVSRISVSGSTISISTNSSTNNVVRWFTDGGFELPSGTSLDVAAHQNRIRSYVRATVSRSGQGILYTQPFGVRFSGTNVLPVLQSVNSNFADITVAANSPRTELGLTLPGGTNVTTNSGVRPATIRWDMNNIIENADKSLTINGTIRLNKINNPNNISLNVSVRVILRCQNCAPKTELIWRPNLSSLTGGRTVSGGVGIWAESSSSTTEINNSRAELIFRDATAGTVLNNRNLFVATAGNAGSSSGWNAANGFSGVVGTEYRLSFSAFVNSGTRNVDVGANRFQNEIENDDGTTSLVWTYKENIRENLTTTPQNISLNFVYSEGNIRLMGSRSGTGITSTTITMRDIEIRKILAYCTGNCAEFAALNVPVITTATLPAAEINKPYTQTLAATGGSVSWSVSEGNLPNGLSLSSDGIISGTPTAAGNFIFTARAANAIGNASRNFSLTINAPPSYEIIFEINGGTRTDDTALSQTITHGENAIAPAV